MLLERRNDILYGAIIGAWLGLVYTWASRAINALFLPGIPLAGPEGGLVAALLAAMGFGALVGAISAVSENRYLGMVAGGLFAALALTTQMFLNAAAVDSLAFALLPALIFFLPLVILMIPLAWILRVGVDARRTDPARPYLWPRRFFVPVLLTLLVVALAAFALYPASVRAAFRQIHSMLESAQQSSQVEKIPAPLREIPGFAEQAVGPYALQYSDRIDTFFGPRPAGADLSQFLIVARFENGYAIACLYSPNRSVPTCTNYGQSPLF